MLTIIFAILAYLCGSVCSAIIICQLFNLPNPRTDGSKNPGATNVLRLAGKKYAIMVLAADFLKGLIPVLIARFFHANDFTLGIVAFMAILGHIYPIFFNFQGGKGVATMLGALPAVSISIGGGAIFIWIIIALTLRYSSLASCITAAALPCLALLMQKYTLFFPFTAISLLILYRHKANIIRLWHHQEPKIGKKSNNS